MWGGGGQLCDKQCLGSTGQRSLAGVISRVKRVAGSILKFAFLICTLATYKLEQAPQRTGGPGPDSTTGQGRSGRETRAAVWGPGKGGKKKGRRFWVRNLCIDTP